MKTDKELAAQMRDMYRRFELAKIELEEAGYTCTHYRDSDELSSWLVEKTERISL